MLSVTPLHDRGGFLLYNDFIRNKLMTILIFVLFAFGIMNIIHHITMIEQLKDVKRNQHDILDALELMIDTMDDTLL